MPPKRQARPTTPPTSTKKKLKKDGKPKQSSIASFFTSPNKPAVKREQSVISFVDSEDEVPANKGRQPSSVENGDAAFARKLAEDWANELTNVNHEDGPATSSKSKGKGKASPTDEDDEEIIPLDTPYSSPPGVNGSTSSKHRLAPPSIKTEPVKLEAAAKPIASIFAPRSVPTLVKDEIKDEPLVSIDDIKPDIKPFTSPANSGVTSMSESVDPIDFDVDAFLFDPGEVDVSLWPKGRLPYSILVGVYVQVSSTRSRLKIVRVLTNFLHLLLKVSPIDLPPSLYLLSNHLLPSYLPSELGIGSQILQKAILEVSGSTPKDLRKLWQKYGDVGDVAYEAKSNLMTLVKPNILLVGDLYQRLLGLIKIKGSQSGKVKGDVVRKMMVQARGEEVRFLVRSLVGNLRIGAVRLTLLTSLARATALHHLPHSLRSAVQPIPPPPEKHVKGQKRVPKAKVEPDPAREDVENICVEATKVVRKVYVRHPNYGDLVRGLEGRGVDGLEDRVKVSVGIPLSPMLGSITRSLNEVFTRLGTLPFTAEAKLDGQRVQIHARLDGPQGEKDGGGRWVEGETGEKVWVRLFSRHLEDMTEKYPDVCQLAHTLLNRAIASTQPFPKSASQPSDTLLDLLQTKQLTSFIIDAEIVAIDKDTGAHRTFQELSNRAKKDVRVEDIKVIVGVFSFDLMLLNDIPLLGSPFSHRRHLLHNLFQSYSPADPTLARFTHVESLDSQSCIDTPAEIQAFFEKVVEQKCEGLMVKLLESGVGVTGDDEEDEDLSAGEKKKGKGKDKEKGGKRKPLPATYEPDQRSQGWLKVKKDYLEGLGDSLDLVPIGAWWGQGRKAGWWSPILLACHNPETGALEAVCKCISGFTDQFYKDLLVRFPPEGMPEKCNKISTLGYYETNGLRPDVWFEPSEVWEIRGADITLSPVYPAAATQLGSGRGLSIRFPRFMKLRDDKSWEEATTSEQFADMYRRQCREAPKVEIVAEIKRDSGDEAPDVDLDEGYIEDEGDVDKDEDEAEAEDDEDDD